LTLTKESILFFLHKVEQLATSTEEESVILTASVADGTLSHLGSQFGKGFLEDHEDIKSQFLGFCLKSKCINPGLIYTGGESSPALNFG
jgi:hypothetical protein